MLTLTPVQSSLLTAIGFDEATGELIIEFPRGARYAYKSENIREHYANLQKAESVGKYFLANIKNKPGIEYRRIEDNPDAVPPAKKEEQAGDEPRSKSQQKRIDAMKAPEPLKQLF